MNPLINYEEVKEIVINAGKMVEDNINQTTIFTKGTADFVTQTDLDVQTYIKKYLQELYPKIVFMGEEENNSTVIDGMQFRSN